MITIRQHRKNFSVYALDFETHNDEESIAKKETSIWLASFINDENKATDENSYFYDIPSLLEHFKKLTNQKRTKKVKPINNILIYVWNLSFEWSFIVPVLLEMGYHWEDEITKDSEMAFNDVSTKSVTSVWSSTIKITKRGGIIKFIDLCKIFPGSLRSVAKSFNLPTQKGDIDYRLNRLHGHIVTDEEKEYCFKDTRIVIDIILEMLKRDDRTFFQIVSAGSYAMREQLKTGFKGVRPLKEFRKQYPELDEQETEFLRKGVEGGITYPTPRYQFINIKNTKILHIDMHQAHPTSAYYNKFPYGKGTYKKGKPNFDARHINCCHVKISYTGVKLHSVIKLIKEPDTISDYEITLWDFELVNMYNLYENLKVDYIDYYEYRSKMLPWRKFYANNYRLRLEAKRNKDQFNIMYYKLLNNSSYGKLLERPHNNTFETIIDANGLINSVIRPKENTAINSTYTYLPVGSCIPAYSRVRLTKTAMLFDYHDIIYFDTDSIFILWNENTKKVWESNLIDKRDFLGGWGLEDGGLISNASFSCAKRYKYETSKGEHIIKMAGVNLNDFYNNMRKSFKALHPEIADKQIKKLDNDYIMNEVYPDFSVDLNNTNRNVQRAYRVKGGTIIDMQKKDTLIAPKFNEIYIHNHKKVI